MGCSTCRHQDKPDDYPACVACRNGSGWRLKEADTLDEMEAQLAEKDKKIAALENTRDQRVAELEAELRRPAHDPNIYLMEISKGWKERCEKAEAQLAAMRDVLEKIRARTCVMGTDCGDSAVCTLAEDALATDAGKGG